MESREEELEQCVARLLRCSELAAPCAETRAAIEEATDVPYGGGPDELRRLRDAALAIVERVEGFERFSINCAGRWGS